MKADKIGISKSLFGLHSSDVEIWHVLNWSKSDRRDKRIINANDPGHLTKYTYTLSTHNVLETNIESGTLLSKLLLCLIRDS